MFVISLSAPLMQGGRAGGSYYRQDQHLTLMILFHASSDGKTRGILEEVKITQQNLGDILINRVPCGLIFPDSGERIIPSHDTRLDCQSEPDVREGAVGWGLGGPFTAKPGGCL